MFVSVCERREIINHFITTRLLFVKAVGIFGYEIPPGPNFFGKLTIINALYFSKSIWSIIVDIYFIRDGFVDKVIIILRLFLKFELIFFTNFLWFFCKISFFVAKWSKASRFQKIFNLYLKWEDRKERVRGRKGQKRENLCMCKRKPSNLSQFQSVELQPHC